MTRYLLWAGDHRPFAYSNDGHLFLRLGDDKVWAYETANHLYSARSGRPLAYRVVNVYYDADRHVPLYREQADSAVETTDSDDLDRQS